METKISLSLKNQHHKLTIISMYQNNQVIALRTIFKGNALESSRHQ